MKVEVPVVVLTLLLHSVRAAPLLSVAFPTLSFSFTIPNLPSFSSFSSYIPSVPKIPMPALPRINDIPGVAYVPDLETIQKKAEGFYRSLSPTLLEDAVLTAPELIRKYGYPCETYHMVTPDGYILEVHRIPFGKNDSSKKKRQVVFLQHGILASSADWIVAGPDKALGYILADAGYDVWMGNNRGNRYSKNHTQLPVDSAEFWNYSFHEIGLYDLPTMIDQALSVSKQEQLHYIGHSQGTTAFYVMCSEKPQYKKKIKSMISLAPIAFMSEINSPILKYIAKGQGGFEVVFRMFGVNQFLPHTTTLSKVTRFLCHEDSITQMLCSNSLFSVCGFSERQMNKSLVPVIMGHTPAGAATKQFVHFGQEVNSGEFRKWDYGSYQNKKIYDQEEPPNYQLEKIDVPIYLFYSKNDWLSAEKDVARLYYTLPNVRGRFLVPDPTFNHVDYLFGIEAKKLIYDPILIILQKH